MTTKTLTLTDFLLARIREQRTRVFDGINHRSGGADWRDIALVGHLSAAEQIVARHRGYGFDEEWAPEGYCPECEGTLSSPCATLRLLAHPHADHPDFDPDWA